MDPSSVDSISNLPPGDFGAALAKTLFFLFLIIALLGVSLWFLRRLIQQRMQKSDASRSIQILEKRVLSPKTMLYLVEVEGKKVLIAESQLEVRRLENLQS
jgi:flagellar protein FliO/FliZ